MTHQKYLTKWKNHQGWTNKLQIRCLWREVNLEKGRMKTTAFLILYGVVLINVELRAVVSAKGEREGDGIPPSTSPHRPSFPSFTFPSFSFPALNLPHVRAVGSQNKMTSAQRILSTKTEYMEVTRRQTVHPVCYTAYEAKAPCLPYEQSYFQDDDYEDHIHHAQESFQLNRGQKVIQPTPAFEITPTQAPDLLKEEKSERNAKYLEIKLTKNENSEDKIESSKIEGSEFFLSGHRQPLPFYTTEFSTKTVLITKLEKYTDRRVTATLLALNCLPVDRSIPMCQAYQSPIRESPDVREHLQINSNGTKAGSANFEFQKTITESTMSNDYL